MAFTAYCRLTYCSLSQASPPLFTSEVDYVVFNTATSSLVNTVQSGGVNGQILIQIGLPIANQVAVLSALQTAVQNTETATPGLSFIWLEL